MGTAYIREYIDVNTSPVEPGAVDQTITTSAVSAQSAAFGSSTSLIAISTPVAQAVACKFGNNPTALVTSLRLPANSVFYFAISPGHKVALIDVA